MCAHIASNQLTGCVEISFRAAVSSEWLSMSSVYTYGFPINSSVYGFCDVSCGVWRCGGVVCEVGRCGVGMWEGCGGIWDVRASNLHVFCKTHILYPPQLTCAHL